MPKISREKGKTAGLIGSAARIVGTAEASVTLIFLSNVGDNLKNILTSQREIFQYTSLALSAIGLAVAAAKLAFAKNKNLDKTQNMAVAIAKFVLVGVITLGAAILAPLAATALFFTLISIDTVIAIGKTIYFGIKAQTAHSEEEKEFFKGKASKNAIGATIGIVTIIAFAIIMAIGHSIAAAAGIIGGIIVGSTVLFSIGKAIHQTFFKKQSNETPQEKADEENDLNLEAKKEDSLTVEATSELAQAHEKRHSTYATELDLLDIRNPDTTPVVVEPEETAFFAHSVTPKRNLEEVEKTIDKHIEKIMREELEDRANGTLWSQTEKRDNKIYALVFLKELLDNSREGITKKGEIQVVDQIFKYQNKEDLIKQIDQHVIKTYPGVYQSFFKDIGKVEDLFRQAYQVLRDTPEPVAVAKEIKNAIETTDQESETPEKASVVTTPPSAEPTRSVEEPPDENKGPMEMAQPENNSSTPGFTH